MTAVYSGVMGVQEYQRGRRESFNEWCRIIKVRSGCKDCGYQAHAAALDFDHRPDEVKSFEIARAANRVRARVLEEIAKCDVVCANCHRVRTFERRNL